MARVFITGSTDGIGLAAAHSLIGQGHAVVLHARNPARAASLDALSGRAAVVVGDLADAAETRAVAKQVNALGRMDAIIHNAGVYLQRVRGDTAEGHATTLAVNTLAPYMLAALVEPPRRLIFTSSALHRGGAGSLADIDWTARPWDAARAYAESKLQVVALAIAIARRWPDLVSSAVHPGWVRTRMGGAGAPVDIDTGQRTQTWLAVSDDPAAAESGRYWQDQRQEPPAEEASDPGFQDRLLLALERLTGVTLPA